MKPEDAASRLRRLIVFRQHDVIVAERARFPASQRTWDGIAADIRKDIEALQWTVELLESIDK